MEIKGFQKVTLIDYPGKIACTLFLSGCNFACGFCHNPELVVPLLQDAKSYSQNEVIEYLKNRKNLLDAVCISGGEPMISLDKDFLKSIKELGYLIKIDTNGTFPERLKDLIDKNLVDFIAMDIKAKKENYESVANSKIDLKKVEESMKIISSEMKNYEFRTTIIEGVHDIEEMKEIAEWLNNITGIKPKKFCLQGFKNKGKLISDEFKSKKETEEKYLLELKDAIKDYFEEVEIRV